MDLLKRIQSNEEIGWDPTEPLKRLRTMRRTIEASVQNRHTIILNKETLTDDEKHDLQQFLTSALHFARTVAQIKAVLELFNQNVTSTIDTIPSTADLPTLLQDLGKVFIELTDELDPIAFASVDQNGRLAPRIVLSIGLLRDLVKRDEENQQRLTEIRTLEQEIRNLPERNGMKIVRNAYRYGTRLMDLEVSNLDGKKAQYEYISSVLFVIAHELAHATYDRFNPPLHAPEWTEVRADLFGIFVTEMLMREAQTKAASNAEVLSGGFHTNDPDKIIRLSSDAGYLVFLDIYSKTKFSEGDKLHLPIDKRKALLEPMYQAMFKQR